MYSESPTGHYVAPEILGNGYITTVTVQKTGNYYVFVMPYGGITGSGTLTFTCR